MAERQISQGLKTALELGPILGFFAAYLWLKDETFTLGGTDYAGFVVITAGFIPVFLASMAVLWWLTGKLSKMQVVTAVLIVVFGGLSVWFNDPRFFKMKPTIIYLLFGGLLGIGLLRGTSWLEYVMEGVMPLTHRGWMILTKRMMLFFFALAVANELVWRTMSEETWVYFKTFGLTAAIFLFFLFQGGLFKHHGTQEAEDQA
jgi:intracellular septation protein